MSSNITLNARQSSNKDREDAPDKLCEVCAAIDFGDIIECKCLLPEAILGYENNVYVLHHGSLTQLEIEANRGCKLCGFLCPLLKQEYQAVWSPQLRAARAPDSHTTPALMSLEKTERVFQSPDGTSEIGHLSFVFDLFRTGTKTNLAGLHTFAGVAIRGLRYGFQGRLRGTVDLSFKALAGDPGFLNLEPSLIPSGPALWKGWIAECQASHSECGSSQVHLLPTRLLQLGSEVESVRVIDSKGMRGSYVALSHCWGSKPPLKTTRSTIGIMLQRVPWHDLPQTFRDAVAVTRDLGYRQLWIDSLCIIQDDSSDWQQECASMGDVYANAAVVIAADVGSDSSAGLRRLAEPVALRSRSCNLSIKWPRRGTSALVAMMADGQDGTSIPESGNPGPLSERGWAVQERIFAPRIIQFGQTQTHFECGNSVRFESFSLPLHPEELRARVRKNIFVYEEVNADYKDKLLQDWYELLQTYANCRLTEGKDRLPAISGLARSIGQKLDTVYHAGVWESDISRALAWVSRNEERLSQRAARHAAPSWSWASWERGVDFNRGRFAGFRTKVDWRRLRDQVRAVARNPFENLGFIECLSLHAATTMPVGQDAFGEVDGGRLTISGLVREVILEQHHETKFLRMRCATTHTVLSSYNEHGIEDPTAMLQPLLAVLLGIGSLSPILNVLLVQECDGQVDTYRRVGALTLGEDRKRDKDCPLTYEEALDWMLGGQHRQIDLV